MAETERIFDATFASDSYLPLFWDIAIRLDPDGADLRRVNDGQVRMLLDHDVRRPIGLVSDASVGEDGLYRCELRVPSGEGGTRRCTDYLREYDDGLRGTLSLGYQILDVREAEDPPDAEWRYMDVDWELLEISDVTVPMDASAAITAERSLRGLQELSESCPGFALGPRAAHSISKMIEGGRPRNMHTRSLGRWTAPAVSRQEIAMADTIIGDRSEATREGDHERVEEEMEPTVRQAETDDAPQTRQTRQAETDDAPQTRQTRQAKTDDAPQTRQTRQTRQAKTDDAPQTRQVETVDLPQTDIRSLGAAGNGGGQGMAPMYLDHVRGGVLARDLDLGMYLRALVDPARYRRSARRELVWMERSLDEDPGLGLGIGEAGLAHIPFSVLAEAGPRARRRQAARARNGTDEEEYRSRYSGAASEALDHLRTQAGTRTMTTGAGSTGAAMGTMVDLAMSIMWLTEMDAAMEMMTVVPGIRGQWQGFYGNTPPTEQWPGEGNSLTDQTPTFQRLQRMPVTVGMPWAISTAQLASADTPIAALVEAGCEAVFRTRAMRAFLSGNRNATDFHPQTNSINGLLNSGVSEESVGGATGNLASYDRGAMVAARRGLLSREVAGVELGWILSNEVATQLETTRIGGTESVRFVLADDMVDSGSQRVPARSTVHLGKTTGTGASVAAVHNLAVILERSAAACLIWGPGIAINALQIPGRTRMDFDLQLHMNFAMMNPARAQILKTAGA